MKKIGLISLVCWFFSPFCLMAQGVNEAKDSVNVEKVDIFNVLMKAMENQRQEVNKQIEKELAPGTEAPDFNYPDMKGKMYSLKDFKGKYVYIDVWATWCGPCCKEIPYLKELEKKMRKKKIVFVSLSWDETPSVWKEMVKKEKLGGIQLHMGRDMKFREAYGITAIPRFILLDKEGKIVNATMTRPSDPQTEKVFNALNGI